MFKETFKALADPVRREILMQLKENPMTAGEIGSKFNLTAPTISYHLNLLKKAELVRERKSKNFIIYSINITVFEELVLWFKNFKGEN